MLGLRAVDSGGVPRRAKPKPEAADCTDFDREPEASLTQACRPKALAHTCITAMTVMTAMPLMVLLF
ncbi:MAG: hypothetical protein A3H24_07195 [Rhodoferax sp. RIFCSPLOWO2_12_FULL_60_11]|nr:MAG: hypothetical protein A3H24_07195 [Rhodoferax sp. RIFCSPLOWO2_12_FULL_60_11]